MAEERYSNVDFAASSPEQVEAEEMLENNYFYSQEHISNSTEEPHKVVSSDDDINELLINEVKSHNCIWDPRCTAYKDRNKKEHAWGVITHRLKPLRISGG